MEQNGHKLDMLSWGGMAYPIECLIQKSCKHSTLTNKIYNVNGSKKGKRGGGGGGEEDKGNERGMDGQMDRWVDL